MSEFEDSNQIIYSKNAIEFVTVAAETCLFLENTHSLEKTEFVTKILKLLPLLYLKTSMVDEAPLQLEDELEDFVTEEDYQTIREQIAFVLGYSDRYLEVFTKDISLSDEPIATDISEDLADIYQDLKNCLLRYQIGVQEVMNDALITCIASFKEYWGQRLANCLRALHNVCYNKDEQEQSEETEVLESTKEHILSHQHNEDFDKLLDSFNA
ncbi:MAG: DUF5063 domain-containing protein [Paludibacteraceae bacterium]|nr:DUF5063 domain-containing protein [Paludibacteraceae bacterium]